MLRIYTNHSVASLYRIAVQQLAGTAQGAAPGCRDSDSLAGGGNVAATRQCCWATLPGTCGLLVLICKCWSNVATLPYLHKEARRGVRIKSSFVCY